MARTKIDKPRAASIRPFQHGGYLCIANHTLMWLPACSLCGNPYASRSRVIRESRAQKQDEQLTLLCIIGTQGLELKGGKGICKRCAAEAKVPLSSS